MVYLLYFFTLIISVSAYKPCNVRKTESGKICVCNATYCDTIPYLMENLKSKEYQLYITSKENLGFTSLKGKFSMKATNTSKCKIAVLRTEKRFQEIFGFGGAFTDATGINILQLSKQTQKLLMEAYFGKNGIEYSVCRVPIGGTDFSTRGYTYCDEKDESLSGFALQKEDFDFKIPFIKQAIELRGLENVKLFASAWTAPKWMKTNNEFTGFTRVEEKYYPLWAKYHLKFLDAYRENGINFWGLTTQNEQINGIIGTFIPSNGFTAAAMKTWVTTNLGPAIRNSSYYKDLKLMLLDDQRAVIPYFYLLLFSDQEVLKYADGIAVHWYTDRVTPASTLKLIYKVEKNLFGLATEACNGYLHSLGREKSVDLGSWQRAELYLDSIFDDLNSNLNGWIDWNMALNTSGGPTWIDNDVDSPIIVNATANEFYKQPMYYALGHFSKFIIPNSRRIHVDVSSENDVKLLAFLRPDGKIAVVLWNRSNNEENVQVNIQGATQQFTLEALSINTLIFVQ